MADIYVRSTDGSDADNGSTWALAKETLEGVDAIDAAGDTVYVSQAHAESTAAAINLTCAGTLSSPTKIIGGNDGAEPPTAVSTAPTVTTTGANGIVVSGAGVYVYGISFFAGSGAGSVGISVGATSSSFHRYENCNFAVVATGASGHIRAGVSTGTNQATTLVNCNVKFANASQVLSICGRLHWNGGGVTSGGTTPTVLFGSWLTASCGLLCENVDFSNFDTGFNFSNAPPTYAQAVIRNCKLPSGWAGALLNGSFSVPGRLEMYNCSAGTENYKLWIEDYLGSIKDEATLIRTGGASDGTTGISWKMVSSATALYPLMGLVAPEIVYWNDTTGSSKTVTVHFLHDSATNLTDAEIGVEVSYLGSSAAPNGTRISDFKADVLASAADQSASSETWTTTGLTNPNEQQASVTFTPQMKGFFLVRVVLFKPSYTVYVCPKAEVA